MGMQKRYSECGDRWFVTYMGNTWVFETEQEADIKVEECKENLRKRGWLK